MYLNFEFKYEVLDFANSNCIWFPQLLVILLNLNPQMINTAKYTKSIRFLPLSLVKLVSIT